MQLLSMGAEINAEVGPAAPHLFAQPADIQQLRRQNIFDDLRLTRYERAERARRGADDSDDDDAWGRYRTFSP